MIGLYAARAAMCAVLALNEASSASGECDFSQRIMRSLRGRQRLIVSTETVPPRPGPLYHTRWLKMAKCSRRRPSMCHAKSGAHHQPAVPRSTMRPAHRAKTPFRKSRNPSYPSKSLSQSSSTLPKYGGSARISAAISPPISRSTSSALVESPQRTRCLLLSLRLPIQHRLLACELLPSVDDHIAVRGTDLQAVAPAA